MARARTDAAPREELRIGYLSEVAHTYLTRLVREGAAHRLTAASLPALPAVDTTPYLLERFSSCWEAVLRESERGPPSAQVVIDPEAPEHSAAQPAASRRGARVWAASRRVITPRFQASAGWKLLSTASESVTPFIIESIVRELQRDSPRPRRAYPFVAALFLASLVAALAIQQTFWQGARVGARVKIAIGAAIYDKCLRLGPRAQSLTSIGQATTLVAADVARLEQMLIFYHFRWDCLLQVRPTRALGY